MIGESEGMQMNEQNAVMEEEIILKKKGVALVKKRLKELLTPAPPPGWCGCGTRSLTYYGWTPPDTI